MDRKEFIKISSMLGGGSVVGSSLAQTHGKNSNSFQKTDLKITKIEVVKFNKGHWTWVKLHTNEGITGIGETYPLSNAEAGALKDLSGMVIGKNPLNIERIWQDLYFRASYNITGGAEMRIISAINIAQWDILGQYLGVPIYQLLGGKVRDSIRVYNTTGHGKIREEWTNDENIEQIAKFLLDRGITAMKIWPFDRIARKTGGDYISTNQIEEGMDWVKRIRDTVGNDMEIAMEFHAHWSLPSAQRIAEALESYNIMWLEDMMHPENTEAFARLSAETSIPVLVSERLATHQPYLEFFKANACDIAMFDVTWCGGITSAKKIADLADAFFIPIAPHTYGGPILWYASLHVAAAVENLYILESGYDFYNGVFPDYLNEVVAPEQGFVRPPEKTGLGISINENIYKNGEASVETITKI